MGRRSMVNKNGKEERSYKKYDTSERECYDRYYTKVKECNRYYSYPKGVLTLSIYHWKGEFYNEEDFL